MHNLYFFDEEKEEKENTNYLIVPRIKYNSIKRYSVRYNNDTIFAITSSNLHLITFFFRMRQKENYNASLSRKLDLPLNENCRRGIEFSRLHREQWKNSFNWNREREGSGVFLEIFPPLPLFEHLTTLFGSTCLPLLPLLRAFNRNSSAHKWPRIRKRNSKGIGDIRFAIIKSGRLNNNWRALRFSRGIRAIFLPGNCWRRRASFARTTQFRRKALMARRS